MKYNVAIPKPSAKRMAANKKIVLTLSDGWTGDVKKEYDIQNNPIFEFNVPDDCEPINCRKCIDGPCFKIEIVYTNNTGSRNEIIELIPMLI